MSKDGMLILVQGLAGSGKSHLIQLLAHDFFIEENFALTPEVESKNIQNLIQNLKCGKRCVISEREYRSSIKRELFIGMIIEAVSPIPAIRIICFENDLETANHNCRHRTNKRHDPTGNVHIQQNEGDTKTYEIPSDAIRVKIYKIPSRS